MTIDKVFLGFAVVGGTLFVLRLLLFFVGLGGIDADTDADLDLDVDADLDVDVDMDVDGDMDADADVAAEGASSSLGVFRLLSLTGLMAFFTIFGLIGMTLRQGMEAGATTALAGAFLAGASAFWLMVKIMRMMTRLQSSGTIRLSSAIGQTGSVYLNIPGDGVGKVQVVVQGRLMNLNAASAGDEALATGDAVEVVGLQAENTLVVRKLKVEG